MPENLTPDGVAMVLRAGDEAWDVKAGPTIYPLEEPFIAPAAGWAWFEIDHEKLTARVARFEAAP